MEIDTLWPVLTKVKMEHPSFFVGCFSPKILVFLPRTFIVFVYYFIVEGVSKWVHRWPTVSLVYLQNCVVFSLWGNRQSFQFFSPGARCSSSCICHFGYTSSEL